MLRICLLVGVALLIGCGGTGGSSHFRVSVARFGELETEPVERKVLVGSEQVSGSTAYGVFSPWSKSIKRSSINEVSTTGYNGPFVLPVIVSPETDWARLLVVSGYGRGTGIGWYPEAHPSTPANFLVRFAAFYAPPNTFDWYIRDTETKVDTLLKAAIENGGDPTRCSAEFPARGENIK